MEVAEDIQAPEQDQKAPPQTDPVEKYYNYLKKAGADVAPNLDSFKRTLADDKSAQQYYDYLKKNKFDAPPTYGSFARTLGIIQPTNSDTTDRDKAVRQEYPDISDLHDSKFADSVLDKNKDKNFVQRYLNPSAYPVVKNEDGTVSTHRMASSDNIAYPTIIQQPDGSLKQLGDKEAYQYARKNNEYISFKNDKDADWFASNGYKLGNQNSSLPENQISHNPIQDLRHLNEMANKPVDSRTTIIDPLSGSSTDEPDKGQLAANKAYQDQYDKGVQDLSKTWGTDPAVTKNVLRDFPNEQDENKLKSFAGLATENPTSYTRLKNANDIRVKIAQDGPNGVNDANVFNHLQNADNYQQLTEENIPYQQQLMRTHGLSSDDMDKLRETQRPLINSLNPGMLAKMWNSSDKELGLTDDEYAGLETERLFNPGKAKIDEGILKDSRGIGDDGKANPVDLSTKPYEYQRGLENVRYSLELLGRDNKEKYLLEHKADSDKQVEALKNDYQAKINNATNPQDQQALIQEFAKHPIVQEANKLEDAAQDLQYTETEDQRRYPLNFSDQATRMVSEAMDNTKGFMGNAGQFGKDVLQGAGESADNTMRWIKNTAINLAGNEQQVAFNNAKNIGHQSLTELAGYEPTSYTGTQSPLTIPKELVNQVQAIFKDPDLSDSEKEQHAISYIRDNFSQLQVNPKAGQQNLTGKAALYQSANMMGQILGIANQSFLLGGLVGDASKLQKMANAFTPMFISTQNQMYEKALKNGEENPLLKSNIDATILSLASLINPDMKVVKGMVGMDTGIGKVLSGIDEKAWNAVLKENKPVLDFMTGAAKATGRQLGLATLQYGVVVPTAQYLAHKSILNEDANLGDMIKDGIIQTGVSMALPSLLHGVWGGVRANEVNPQQKYAIVEAGLHPDQNIDLVESKIKAGLIPEIQGHEMKQLIKHSGEILQNGEFNKTDGTPMNENEVADVVYSQLRKKVLENKIKTASEPIKPIIEEKIHEINQDIAELHTSDDDMHKNELNQLLADRLDKIKDKAPEFEDKIKAAIKENNPEEIFKLIADKANETKSVEGKEVSLKSDAEDIFGKKLVAKALDISKNGNNFSRENIKNNNNTLKNVNQRNVREVSEKQSDVGSEVLSGLPQRVYEELAKDPSIRGNSEAESKLQGIRSRIQGSGAYSEDALRGMSESERRDAPRRLLETFRGEMAMPGMPPEDAQGREGKSGKGSFLESRHADTVDDERGKVSGPNDNPLSKDGRKDANDLAKEIEGKGVTKIITSDLERAKETGKVVADKTGATTEHRPELNTWDIGDFDKASDEEFKKAQKYFVENPDAKEFEGKKISESFNEYKDRVIKARTALEGEPASTLVINHSNNMMLWDAYKRNGNQWNEQAAKDYLSAKTPEPATLSGGDKGAVSGGNPPAQVAPSNADELPFGNLPVGIAHHLQEQRSAAELNVLPPERGEGITKEESIQRGKDLIAGGVNPDQIVTDFKKSNRLSSDDMAVVRARYNEFAQNTNKAYDQHGEDSPEAKAAFAAERGWYTDAVKPMQTEWSKIGTAQQGAVDLDTGSVTSIKRAFQETSGKPLTDKQAQTAKDFHSKIKERDTQIADLQKKLDEVINNPKEAPIKGVKEKAKDLAKKIRDNAKLSRPGMFSAATPASLAWDGGVEIVAKSIEAGGAIADAILKGIDHIKASDWYKGLSKKDQNNAVKQFTDWHNDQASGKIDIVTHFVDKKDNNFTPNESKAIWEHAKGVIKGGKTDFNDVVKQTAMDTGLSSEQVRRAISQPKGAKVVTDEMYAAMYHKRQVLESAKIWVKTADQSDTKKFWNKVIKLPSAIVTFGHGSVAPITHVGADLYRPTNWKSYFNFMGESYRYSFGGLTDAGKARYEKAMADLVRDPMYMMAKKAGLKIDPTDKSGDDYSKYEGVLGKISKMGERGFNAMKPYRLEQFKKIYNGLSDQAKGNNDVITAIADMVNLSSGTTSVNTGKYTDAVLFAPKLVVSQYQRIFSEPWKAVGTFAKWGASKALPESVGQPTDAEKLQAKMVARHAGEMVGTYLTLLAANQAILTMTGSKQKVNFTNPLDSDWMKFKVAGKAVEASGGMNSALRFVSSLGEEALRANGVIKTDEKAKPGDSEGKKILQQASNKLSPFAGDIKEVASGTDMMGNPLPWSAVKPGAGKEKLTWGDYVAGKVPIPLAEGFKAFHDAAKDNGMPVSTYNKFMQGVLVGGLTGTTGARIGPDTQKKESTGRKPRGE